MMKHVSNWLSRSLTALCLTIAVSAFAQAGIDGKWDLSADSPHGKLSMELDLTRTGEALSGTLLDFGGKKRTMKGTFKNDTLTIESTPDGEFALTGKLKADGTLSGQLSTPMGDVNWTGVRAKRAK